MTLEDIADLADDVLGKPNIWTDGSRDHDLNALVEGRRTFDAGPPYIQFRAVRSMQGRTFNAGPYVQCRAVRSMQGGPGEGGPEEGGLGKGGPGEGFRGEGGKTGPEFGPISIFGQFWDWPDLWAKTLKHQFWLNWPNIGKAKIGLGQRWFGQTWFWPNLAIAELVHDFPFFSSSLQCYSSCELIDHVAHDSVHGQ